METSRKINYTGEIDLNGYKIPCYVLEDGTRILSGRGIQSSLKLLDEDGKAEQRSGARFARFLAGKTLKPFLFKDKALGHYQPILAHLGGQPITGYEATLLPDLCDAVLEARAAGVLKTERQQTVATQCEILIRGFARVGIIALVDEATGFQEVRALDALQKYLNEFLLKEHAKWALRFPEVFFRLLFQMMGWQWNELSTRKPQYIGKLINNLVYERLGPNILHELRERNPANEKGNRAARHHQFFSENVGHPKLQEHLASLMALLRAAGCNRAVFNRLVDAALPRFGYTIPLALNDATEPKQLPPAKPENEFDAGLKGLMAIPPPPKPEKRKKPKPLKDDEADGESAAELVQA